MAFLACWLCAAAAGASVRVFVQGTNGIAWIKYECTAGEVVRSFALNVTVDRGVILGVSNYLRGPSSVGTPGYGIFPSSFRDHVTLTFGTNADWSSSAYTPIASVADNPSDTLPGLDSSGVTLEFGALWDPAVPASAPPPAGTLCAVQISQLANVTVGPNSSRGGVVAAPPDVALSLQFAGAAVDPEIAVTQTAVNNGILTIFFKGGELESAPTLNGPWTGTGNTSGNFSEPINTTANKFYRVHRP